MAVTITNQRNSITSDRHQVDLDVAAGWSNGDTIDTGLASIDVCQISYADATIAAADAVSHTISGGTITLVLIGTARALDIFVKGLPKP